MSKFLQMALALPGMVAAKVEISESCFVPFKPLEEKEWKAGVWGEGEEEL